MQNNKNLLRVLFLGDVVGFDSLKVLENYLLDWRKELSVDMVIVNGENLTDGSGITVKSAMQLWRINVDVVTSGDHIWRQRDFVKRMQEFPFVIRPANYPPASPGRGYAIWMSPTGVPVAVVNLLGRVFMQPVADCPFRKMDELLEELSQRAKIIIVDFHAEATSEKVALGFYLDGRVSAVIGTHTHIPTADERILPKGTAYITDVGMVGPYISVLGRSVDSVIQKYIKGMPVRFPVAEPPIWVNGVVIDINIVNGRAVGIQRWSRTIHLE